MSTPNMPSRPIPRCQAITDMIESIAEEQAALGSILTAEADKLDKIVCTCAHHHELLEANQSVNQLIRSVTQLEMILQSKLELFKDCLCPCPCPPHPADEETE